MASSRPNGEFRDIAEVNLATRIPNPEPVAQLLALGCTVLVNWDDSDDIQLVAYLPAARKEDLQLIQQVDLTHVGELSSTGKSRTVASTKGNKPVPGHDTIMIGLNVYKPVKGGRLDRARGVGVAYCLRPCLKSTAIS